MESHRDDESSREWGRAISLTGVRNSLFQFYNTPEMRLLRVYVSRYNLKTKAHFKLSEEVQGSTPTNFWLKQFFTSDSSKFHFFLYAVNPRGQLKYNVVSRYDQENTVQGLFFEIRRCVRATRLGVQKKGSGTFFKIL